MDTASSQPGELTLPTAAELAFCPELRAASEHPATPAGAEGLTSALLDELWRTAEAESCAITTEEFCAALFAVGQKHNYNQPPGAVSTPVQQAVFYRGLRLGELALAHGCALGRDAAWERFLALYRAPITQAAIAITGSATVGHDLADSLYAELFGLRETDGRRRSPLASYSGRGSLMGWLRTTLAQRHIDHHRRTHRETPLDKIENTEAVAVQEVQQAALPAELVRLTEALAKTLSSLDSEARFVLSAYFLDRQTLLQIARLLHVHEATVSRKLKRLTEDIRKQLLRNLQSGGLSKRAAEEALGVDPRDLELNLRALLQSSQPAPFSGKAELPPEALQPTKDSQPPTNK